MTRKFLEEIKTQLLAKKRDLEKEIEEGVKKSEREGSGGYEAKFPDFGRAEDENADEVATFADRLSLEGNIEKRIFEIEAALERIKAGKYGKCENCHRQIEEKRLRVFPTARFCLVCKEKIQKKE